MLDQAIRDKYVAVIGLEVHAQLLTKSKMYAPEVNEYGSMPNTNISVITLGHPGTLPKVNKQAVEYALKMGLACDSAITRENIFDRKNYFYPDLPKGYQVTQDKTPICRGGQITIKPKDGQERHIHLTRIHMEEDAGKSMHLEGETDTLVDFNRAGVPLIEIVTEPDLRTSEEAYSYLTEIRRLVRYLDICDGNMEEGSLRCDANISVMLKDAKEFGKKVEVKNMNSIRNVQRAIEHEIERQIIEVEKGNDIPSETRNFDATTGSTVSMRTKEAMNDYRYFPEPDLAPLIVSDEWLERVKSEMPPLPRELYKKFIQDYGLPAYDAEVLTDSKEIALYFEEICKHTDNYKSASNWVMGPVKSHLNELTLHIEDFPITPKQIAELIAMVDGGKISHTIASQKVYPEMIKQPEKSPAQIAEEQNLLQESDEGTLQKVIDEVLQENPAKVEEYKGGKKSLLGMFMGQLMKKTKGKADPKLANQMLRESLEG